MAAFSSFVPATSVLIAFATTLAPAYADQAASDPKYPNLKLVADSEVATAYIDPEADFSRYGRVLLLEPLVEFRENWLRDQNRTRSRPLKTSDAERIQADVAKLFDEVFAERVVAAGYQVADAPANDVLLLRPAIINLDVIAPDEKVAGRAWTFSAATGAATLYIELYDSISSEILGRAIDRKSARSPGTQMRMANSVSNSADARRMLGKWADLLTRFLDEHYIAPGIAPAPAPAADPGESGAN
jgi:hypothetical protein